MMYSKSMFGVLSVGFLMLVIAGCGEKAAIDSKKTSPPGATSRAESQEKHHEHAHQSVGPHRGEIIELGDESYHAELLHDDQEGTVTIYILDDKASGQIPINVNEITINGKTDGKPAQFKLSADPDANETGGMSSRFVSHDKTLLHHLEDKHGEAQLVIMINDKSYRGIIATKHAGSHDGISH